MVDHLVKLHLVLCKVEPIKEQDQEVAAHLVLFLWEDQADSVAQPLHLYLGLQIQMSWEDLVEPVL